jgi:hypothetical protein
LNAAQRLYEADGLGGMSFRAIAAELSCSHSMPSAYFPSKAHLVSADDPLLVAAKIDAIGVCREVIEAAVASGAATLTVDAQTAAHLFWVAAHGLVSLEHGGFLVVGRTIDQILPALFGSVLRGVIESEGT